MKPLNVRRLSILLVLCMLITCIPSAFANEVGAESQEAPQVVLQQVNISPSESEHLSHDEHDYYSEIAAELNKDDSQDTYTVSKEDSVTVYSLKDGDSDDEGTVLQEFTYTAEADAAITLTGYSEITLPDSELESMNENAADDEQNDADTSTDDAIVDDNGYMSFVKGTDLEECPDNSGDTQNNDETIAHEVEGYNDIANMNDDENFSENIDVIEGSSEDSPEDFKTEKEIEETIEQYSDESFAENVGVNEDSDGDTVEGFKSEGDTEGTIEPYSNENGDAAREDENVSTVDGYEKTDDENPSETDAFDVDPSDSSEDLLADDTDVTAMTNEMPDPESAGKLVFEPKVVEIDPAFAQSADVDEFDDEYLNSKKTIITAERLLDMVDSGDEFAIVFANKLGFGRTIREIHGNLQSMVDEYHEQIEKGNQFEEPHFVINGVDIVLNKTVEQVSLTKNEDGSYNAVLNGNGEQTGYRTSVMVDSEASVTIVYDEKGESKIERRVVSGKPTDFVITLDVSGSMSSYGRDSAMKSALKMVLEEILQEKENTVRIVLWATRGEALQLKVDDQGISYYKFSGADGMTAEKVFNASLVDRYDKVVNYSLSDATIGQLESLYDLGGWTQPDKGLIKAIDLLSDVETSEDRKVGVMLFTDGWADSTGNEKDSVSLEKQIAEQYGATIVNVSIGDEYDVRRYERYLDPTSDSYYEKGDKVLSDHVYYYNIPKLTDQELADKVSEMFEVAFEDITTETTKLKSETVVDGILAAYGSRLIENIPEGYEIVEIKNDDNTSSYQLTGKDQDGNTIITFDLNNIISNKDRVVSYCVIPTDAGNDIGVTAYADASDTVLEAHPVDRLDMPEENRKVIVRAKATNKNKPERAEVLDSTVRSETALYKAQGESINAQQNFKNAERIITDSFLVKNVSNQVRRQNSGVSGFFKAFFSGTYQIIDKKLQILEDTSDLEAQYVHDILYNATLASLAGMTSGFYNDDRRQLDFEEIVDIVDDFNDITEETVKLGLEKLTGYTNKAKFQINTAKWGIKTVIDLFQKRQAAKEEVLQYFSIVQNRYYYSKVLNDVISQAEEEGIPNHVLVRVCRKILSEIDKDMERIKTDIALLNTGEWMGDTVKDFVYMTTGDLAFNALSHANPGWWAVKAAHFVGEIFNTSNKIEAQSNILIIDTLIDYVKGCKDSAARSYAETDNELFYLCLTGTLHEVGLQAVETIYARNWTAGSENTVKDARSQQQQVSEALNEAVEAYYQIQRVPHK